MPKSRRKKRGPGDIRHQLLIFFAALIVLEGIVVFVAIEYRSKQAALRQDAGILLRARELAHNARVKNNELHLLAKDAVAYGDPRSIRDYEARARPQASDADFEGGGVILRDQPNPRARDNPPEGARIEEMPRFDPSLAFSQEQVQTNLQQISTKSVQFQGDELSVFDAALAASGYNAGAGQTVLWSGGSDRPAEALLAAISYSETRTYVRRVLANRRAYRLALPDDEAIGGRR